LTGVFVGVDIVRIALSVGKDESGDFALDGVFVAVIDGE
jgi:hypothetical protein